MAGSAAAPSSQLARKQNGAYYTGESVARFLVSWALTTRGSSVLDPSCGDGVFLRQALAARVSGRLVGVDVQPEAVNAAKQALRGNAATVILNDFFTIAPDELGQFHAVVGNPPFIRFHRFAGRPRARALAAAKAAGVELSALSSAWAPFLVHAARFLKPGGRLAMVAPGELLHAAYARPVLRYLSAQFERTVVITFERRLFPELSQDTVLVLGESRGGAFRELRLLNLADQYQLETLLSVDPELTAGRRLRAESLLSGEERALQYLLPTRTRQLYSSLASRDLTARLGEWATVSIGYVTGNNEFFHLSKAEAAAMGLDSRYLRPAVRRSDELKGLTYTKADWLDTAASGAKCTVLDLPATSEALPEAVGCYLAEGRGRGVHRAYKCRVRHPWYKIPGILRPDAFLSYMVHLRPRVAANRMDAVAPNSLLAVTRRPAAPSMEYICTAMGTSLSLLSAELEGHTLGGGMLKLEPGEAARLVLPLPSTPAAERRVRAGFAEMDALLRERRSAEAQDFADSLVLQGDLGLSARQCKALAKGCDLLRRRRLDR